MNGSPSVHSGILAGRYAIERELGRGGTAVVFLARDETRGETVAVKLLRSELVGAMSVARFLREIRLTERLQHPRIVPTLASGELEGQPYLVMPFMEGGTLRQRLQRETQLPMDTVLTITRSIADALTHAHAMGIVHRDVKPENILFANGDACLADFGIARALEQSTDGTASTSGTPLYMSPEQASGTRNYDGRSDIYSLACVVYEMLAGIQPFIGPTAESVMAQKITETARSVRIYRPAISSAVERVLARALLPTPADRYQTATEFVEQLDKASRTPDTRGVLFWRRNRRRVMYAAAVVGVAVSALIVARATAGPRFTDRDWILVADFDGPRDDPGLATAVRELATAELNQSRLLSTLPRSQLNATMRLAGVPDTTRVGPQLARELAYRSAVRAVLVGSITRVGPTYSIVLHAVDVADGTDILWVDAPATDATLIPVVQRLARRVRSGLGERRSSIEAALPLDQVATPSFAAYRKYAEGLRLQTRGDGRNSNQLMREALALDTGFASAWFSMGWNYQNERMMDSARWAFSRALARRARLSDAQRYRLEADAAYAIDYDIPAAIHAYDLYLTASPRSWAGYNNRGNYLVALGRYDDALQSFERAVAVHPFGPQRAQIQVANEAATLIALRRLDDADRVARDLTGTFATYIRLMRGAAADQWSTMDSLARTTMDAPSSPGFLKVPATAVAAGTLAVRGAVGASDSLLAAAMVRASPDVARWYQRARLLLAQASGRPMPPLPAALARDQSPAALVTAGLTAAMAGDSARAGAVLRALDRADSVELRTLGQGPLLIRAWLAARAGDWSRAASLVDAPARRGEHDTAILDRVGSQSLRWLAADALARSGRMPDAAAMLELAIAPERMSGNEFALRGVALTFAHARLARWYETMGRRHDAAAHWRAVRDALQNPDASVLPLLTEARSSLSRLAGN